MPFHWNISEPRKTFERNKNTNKIDRRDVANQRIVASMRNLLQLIKLADDIFTDIESECRNIYDRTTKLNIKIQHCQGIVDKLNAKEVKVPRATHPTDSPPFRYSGAQVSQFSDLGRSPVIARLRDSADGPVLLLSGMVASQVDRTHIYCTAVKMKDAGQVASRKSMSSSSNVVAIDVSGQPFSRMASLRRSLIHVDFLLRRKQKKDKRRNTVSEGEVVDAGCLCSYQPMVTTERNNNKAFSKPLEMDETVGSKQRKPKSHIPISTVSAAMNVAVEMRHTTHGDQQKEEENWLTSKKRFQEKSQTLTSNQRDLSDSSIGKEDEISSTASSEYIDPQDSLTESETFFISSDESDEESSENYGTASDGSLNSLLSENGSEMTSSTGTLTSLGQEHLLTPPPPPPPMILSAKELVPEIEIDTSTRKAPKGMPKKGKKIKTFKSDFRDMHRNLTENSKNIFSSLVSLKDKNKNKSLEKPKTGERTHQPAFDMYGNSSTKEKEIPTFMKENLSPSIPNETKNDMKSFCVKERPYQLSNNEIVNKLNLPLGTYKNSPSSDNLSTNHAVNSIPAKYEHQLMVKPIQRYKETENKVLHDETPVERENMYCTTLRQSWWGTENAPRVRPNPPVTPKRSKAARVVLDYNGQVIYSTNSLDRKHYSLCPSVNMYNSVHSATWNKRLEDMKLNKHSCREMHPSQVCPPANSSSYVASPQERAATFSTVPCETVDNLRPNEPYLLGQSYDIPSSKCRSDIFVPERIDACLYERHCSKPPLNRIIRDPNISGLPVQDTSLSRHNVRLHSKRMEEKSEKRHSKELCLKDILNKSPQSTMSTEDLFAMIHNCKKRMNIKTDPDITSSRSSSPSSVRPKSILAETGFLSPRGGDRKSWPHFRPVESVCPERKCLASDRLGPTKPTSMHDFKMLLLQARTSSQISGPRKSAVEMLKVPFNPDTPPTLLSPRNYFSISLPNSPSTEYSSLSNGHSTVPFKRGHRGRTSLQPRYILYPPIFEDCSEDSENINLEKERLG